LFIFDFHLVFILFNEKRLIYGIRAYQKDPSYYLLGTLINVSVALVFAVAAKTFIQN